MNPRERQTHGGPFGTRAFEFGDWPTPFTDATVDILDVAYAPGPVAPDPERAHGASLLRGRDGADLVARVLDRDADVVYRLVFPKIAAMRLSDESGLPEIWQKTSDLGGRPGRTTFRVRNHAWTKESVIPFLASDGWCFVIATEDACLEVVSVAAPVITAEQGAAR
jgi:hypothetical protein